MSRVFKQTYTRDIPADGEIFEKKGKKFVRFTQRGGKRITAPLTADGKRCRIESSKWYGDYIDADGINQTVPLATDRTAADQMLAELVKKAAQRAAGLTDKFDDHRQKPLADHLEDFRAYLEGMNRSEKHVSKVFSSTSRMLKECGFFKIPDLSKDRLDIYLAKRRQPTEAGEPGLSIAASNDYIAAITSFLRWMVSEGRIPANPLAGVKKQNPKLDVRHERRASTLEEISWLTTAARNGKPFRGISGEDRAMLYAVAVYTGLRVSELASLSRNSFNLESTPATVTVEACYSKHRREDVLPLPLPLVDALKAWFAGALQQRISATLRIEDAQQRASRKSTERLWPGTWTERACRMIQSDWRAARDAWIEAAGDSEAERKRREESDFLKYENSAGEVADFHSLRHTFITLVVKSGVDPKTAKELARHSTITLTMDRYSHIGLLDMHSAVERLSDLPEIQQEAARATGTDDLPVDGSLVLTCPSTCPTAENSCDSMRVPENEPLASEMQNPPVILRKTLSYRGNLKQPPGGLEPSTYALRKRRLILVSACSGSSLHKREFIACPSACPEGLREVIEAWEKLTDEERREILAIVARQS